MSQHEQFLGLMSGTSLDGVDAVVMQLGSEHSQIIDALYRPYPSKLKQSLQKIIAAQNNVDLDTLYALDIELGRFFANTALALMHQQALTQQDITAIGCHGQTIRHRPPGTQALPYTLQIGDPNTIAQITGITTVADFRRRDMAAGGQGAPLVPAFHAATFQSPTEYRVIINIGGIANITVLPPSISSNVHGFDTGPGNTLMNIWAQQHFQADRDEQGAIAASGVILDDLLTNLLADPYFTLQPPKTTGTEYFNAAWLSQQLAAFENSRAEDIMATLNRLTAQSIAQHIKLYASNTEEVFVCGGGVHNATLMQNLDELLPLCNVASTATLGINPDYVEAAAFACLAKMTLNYQTGNIPGVTGAEQAVILGGVYPAA